jgi:pimeloyl-ACP methyl ester carboxylesterase
MPSLNIERLGRGEPMLLLHGIGGELCVWEPVLEPLAEHLDVIAVDLPGFGHSAPLPDGTAPTAAALAVAVARLMDELGIESAHLAGNSLGGWIALELGKTERARSVTALCPAGLWSGPLDPEGTPAPRGAQRVARALRPLLPLAMLSPRLRRLALARVVAHPERVPRAAASRMVSSYARSTAYDATNVAMRQSHFTGAAQIRASLTVAFGERDRLIRPARVHGAHTLVLPGCGHIPMFDDAELVTRLLLETVGRVTANKFVRSH